MKGGRHPEIFGGLQRRSVLKAGVGSIFSLAHGYGAVGAGAEFPPGLVGDGNADNVGALRAALVGGWPVVLPPGRFHLTDGLRLARGQPLAGSGVRATTLVVRPGFRGSVGGVVAMDTGEPGGEIRDLTISFAQPDSGGRAGLATYPPAIRAVEAPRFKVGKVRVQRATVGLDMRGNSGGAVIDDLEVSAFRCAVWIDGARDSVKLSKLHVWPFGLTPTQVEIYKDGATVGLQCGRCDDIHLSDGIVFGLCRAAVFTRTAAGRAFGSIAGMNFDHRGGLVAEEANLRVQGCTFTIGSTPAQWIVARAGALDVTGCHFHSAVNLASPGVELGGGGLSANLAACSFNTGAADFTHLSVGGTVYLTASGITFSKAGEKVYRSPLVQIRAGARAALGNLVATDLRTNSGVIIDARSDSQTTVAGLIAPGWRTEPLRPPR